MPLTLSDHHAAAAVCDLLCSEDASEVAGDTPGGSGAAPWRAAEFPDDSDESIAWFIEEEADYSPGRDYPDRFRSNPLDSVARQEAVAWIIKVHAYYRFRPLTAYLAVNYMDRFLSSHRLPKNEWALQLLSVACLSLAAKMEETLLPPLLDLQVEDARFIFESRTILRMELLVLNSLNWRLRSITPFTFMDFFVHKIDPVGKYAQYLVSWATEITLATMKDFRFLSHCPSSLAAAAIICAADEVKDLAFVNPAIAVSWSIGLTEEGITSCYQSMQKVIIERMRKPPMMLSQLRLSTQTDIGPRASSSSSSPPNKRRKLNNNSPLVDNDKGDL
ncbi:cyclin-D2-1-like isoform X1 [Canna indica]|uniref:Cyclin-D2-1-like isoform X1 n=1 Tax=Canna indica TaxID=4628 RepID=A0AAQ3JWF0_9LILI|nr:cyclin-D2-1-like isoform X1 [Canna indica]